MSLYDDRFAYPGVYRLATCAACGHRFADKMLENDVLETLYTQYYQRENSGAAGFAPYTSRKGLTGWLEGERSTAAEWVPPGVKVLDIGCGLGSRVAYHAQRGCEAHGIDADANVRQVAEKYGLNIRVGLFNPDDYAQAYFDYVTMDQVIEHVSDPADTLRGIARILRPGGYCVLSTPNANGWGARLFGRRWLNWHVPYHQHFVSPASMRRFAESAGFTVERISTCTRSAWLLYQFAHLRFYPAPEEPSAFWVPKLHAPGTAARRTIRMILAAKFTLLPQLCVRLFDAIGLGDNYVIVLRKAE